MTTTDLLSNLPIATAVIIVVWALRLEGRVNTHEAVCAERYRRLDERAEESAAKLHEIDAKLDRLVNPS
jgi:hypothetical protein